VSSILNSVEKPEQPPLTIDILKILFLEHSVEDLILLIALSVTVIREEF
jgi:hypothetical protein